MKKYLVFIFVILLLFITACNNEKKYDEWKDTHKVYGDGTYQIIHQENKKILTNCKHNQCVLTTIDNYTEKDTYVYFVGDYYLKKVYCKLDTTTNMLSYFVENNDEDFIMVYLNDMLIDKQIELLSSFDEFSEIDKSEFIALKAS